MTTLFALIAALGFRSWALALGCSPRLDQPVAITYDHEACDHCGMLVSDPRFAAQLVTREGERHAFDDPACLFRYVMDHHPSLANVWFRDSTTTTPDADDPSVWLPGNSVGFVPATGTPMGGGLAAVPTGTPGAIGFGEASSRILTGATPPPPPATPEGPK